MPSALARKAQIYREVLSLLLAGRRPAYYLRADLRALELLTDRYVDWLARAGVIDDSLRDATHAARLRVRPNPPTARKACCLTQKATDALRTELLSVLNVASFYDMDRLDLTGSSTIDLPAQARVSDILAQLNNPDFAKAHHLVGYHLLHATLIETELQRCYPRARRRSGRGACACRQLGRAIRYQFCAKLLLGSTAKFRTLVTYLNIITTLHDRYVDRPKAELIAEARGRDPLTVWAMHWLTETSERGLRPMLDAAMHRRYSAAPGAFFTNGGVHHFRNFEEWEIFAATHCRRCVR